MLFSHGDMCALIFAYMYVYTNIKNVMATALAWFLYDIAYYGSNAFTPTLTAAVFGSGDDDKDNIKSIAAEVRERERYVSVKIKYFSIYIYLIRFLYCD
jgi:hypothetical protein